MLRVVVGPTGAHDDAQVHDFATHFFMAITRTATIKDRLGKNWNAELMAL